MTSGDLITVAFALLIGFIPALILCAGIIEMVVNSIEHLLSIIISPINNLINKIRR